MASGTRRIAHNDFMRPSEITGLKIGFLSHVSGADRDFNAGLHGAM